MRQRTILAAGVLGLGVLGVAQAGFGGSDMPTLEKKTLVLIHQTSGERDRFVDNPPHTTTDPRTGIPKRVSAGDYPVAGWPVLDASRRRAGTGEQLCMFTSAAREPDKSISVCTVLLRLKGGILTGVQSPDFSDDRSPRVVAVTGGTGAFTGATGQIVAGNKYEITLYLPKG